MWDRELSLGMSITKLSGYPFHMTLASLRSFLTAGPGRTIIWLIKIEGHRPPDNNEVSRALPFYALGLVADMLNQLTALNFTCFGNLIVSH